MSEMQNKAGCFKTAARLLVVVVLVGVSRWIFTGFEVVAAGFTSVGVHDPALAWGLMGAIVGAFVGFIVGLRRNGRRRQLPEMALAVGAVVLLAYAGLEVAEVEPLRPVETRPPALYAAQVNAQLLNVRAGASNSTASVDEVPYGVPVDVLETSGSWLRVRYHDEGGAVRSGWVYHTYVDRVARARRRSPAAREADRTTASGGFLPCYRPPQGALPGRGYGDAGRLQTAFDGTIGDDLAVRMVLHVEGGDVAGAYYYRSEQKEIRLEGTCTETGLLHMRGYHEGEHVDVFRLRVEQAGAALSGRWSAADGPRSLPFAATATSE